MSHLQPFDEERTTLKWGGLAGMLGSLLFIFVFAWVGVVVGADPVEPAGAIARFPDIRVARTVENGVYLAALILWAVHFAALYRALRATSLAASLFGTLLAIVGMTILAAGALPHAASVIISDVYHAPGATAADQATLALVWQGHQGVFTALLVTGLAIVPFGVVGLGTAMLGAPAFGRLLGWASVGLGLAAAASALVMLVDPTSAIAVIGFLALIVFHLAVGWRVYALSRTPWVNSTAWAAAESMP